MCLYRASFGVIGTSLHEVEIALPECRTFALSEKHSDRVDEDASKLANLDALIEEYYVPEFGEDVRANGMNLEFSCNKAMGVIKAWS